MNMLRSLIPKITFNIRHNLPIVGASIRTTNFNAFNNNHCKPTYSNHKRTYSTSNAKKTEKGMLNKIFNKLGLLDLETTRMKVTAYMLYESVADKIDYEYFFQEFQLPDTFNSWFLVTELHVWMLLVRAMGEGSEKGSNGRFIRNNIVEALWADVATRTKQLRDVNSYGIKQQIQLLSEQFQYAIIGYDEGLGSDDITLAGALWRRFFEQNCDDPRLLERIVIYVRKQISTFDEIPSEVFLTKRDMEWLSIKDI